MLPGILWFVTFGAAGIATKGVLDYIEKNNQNPYNIECIKKKGIIELSLCFTGKTTNDILVPWVYTRVNEMIQKKEIVPGKKLRISGPTSVAIVATIMGLVSPMFDVIEIYDTTRRSYLTIQGPGIGSCKE